MDFKNLYPGNNPEERHVYEYVVFKQKSRDFPKISVHEFNLRVSHIAIAEHLWLQGEPNGYRASLNSYRVGFNGSGVSFHGSR